MKLINSKRPYPYNLLAEIYETDDISFVNDNVLEELSETLKILTDRQLEIMILRFQLKYSINKLSKKYHTCENSIYSSIHIIIDKLKTSEMKKYYDKYLKEQKQEKLETDIQLNKPIDLFSSNPYKKVGILKAIDDSLKTINIETLNLSNVTYNCLKRKDINNLYELCKMTTKELLSIYGFGKGRLNEVLNALHLNNLLLSDEADKLYIINEVKGLVPIDFSNIKEHNHVLQAVLVWDRFFKVGNFYIKFQLFKDSSVYLYNTKYKVIIDCNYPIRIVDKFGHHEKNNIKSIESAKQYITDIYNTYFLSLIESIESDIKELVIY